VASSKRELCGVLPVFQTPYHPDETIDYDTLEREIAWLHDCGAHGIVMAMVSETLRLASEERGQLAEAACQFGRARGVVIISVGAESSKVAERFARHAEAVGADAVMAIPPVSVGIGEGELVAYYRRIIESVSIPVIVQDASGYVGRAMSIGMQARLLEEFGPDRVLYKPEANPIGPRLSELREATRGRARIFEGSGGIALVDSFRRGIVGTMPGADLIRGLVPLWRALEAGHSAKADRIHGPLAALISMQTSLDAFLAVEKHLLVRQGIFKNALVRGPVGFRLDEGPRREVDRLFDRMIEAAQQTTGTD
jgi:4-hydroxy-tetrahydrodipicolinate synthase